jgi:Outer membrane lipoprotein carrier protein LolA-like
MISGKTITMLLALAPMSLWAAAPAPDAVALIATLGRPAPSRTPFAEARFMRVLDQPLVVSGELAWLGGDKLQRRVDAPRKETSTIADGEVTLEREGKGTRTFSLQRAPQLKVLLDSFVALLGGDASRLGDAFVVDLVRKDARWTITLTPSDAKIAKQIGRIVVDGAGNEPRCMRMEESDGDVAVDLLGALSTKMPAAPTREGLLALCTAAP